MPEALRGLGAMTRKFSRKQEAFVIMNTDAPRMTRYGASLAVWLLALMPLGGQAQKYPITEAQKATAQAVAGKGVALADLRADAPKEHVVVKGDTLWNISKLFLNSPWRWPELWGMNLESIRNPHLIYPGQRLVLNIRDGRATLGMSSASRSIPAGADLAQVRLSPQARITALADSALPTLEGRLIEPFLSEPIILGEEGLSQAPRIVAAQDARVLLTRGDRAYARSSSGKDLIDDPQKKHKVYRIFRDARALRDPDSGVILGYEAQYIGRALLMRSESSYSVTDKEGKRAEEAIPATIDIVAAKEEIRVGDRLVPEPPAQVQNYVPHAAKGELKARVVSVYGSAVDNAAQNQVVVINKGRDDGLQAGQVLSVLNDGVRLVDGTDANKAMIKLPDERNGLVMVFRPFDKLSYALILEITRGVKVGDRLSNPS